MSRSFKLQKTMSDFEKSSESLLDIPHIAVLHYRNLEELIQLHKERWGLEPTGICMPVTAQDGTLFEIEELRLPMSRYASKSVFFEGFDATLQDASKKFKQIFLTFDPTLPFCSADALHIEDIVGDSSSQVCFGNPASIEVSGMILGRAIDKVQGILARNKDGCKLMGAAIDCVNLFPMGAEDKRVALTCFCQSCIKWFEQKKPGIVGKFRDFPNPWNLVLADEGSGVSQISDITPSTNPIEIVGMSRLRKFEKAFAEAERSDANLINLARSLLEYIVIRHQQVVKAAHAIFDDAYNGLESLELKRVLIMEGAKYDWTAGLQLARLDTLDRNEGGFDELWFHPTSPEIIPKIVKYRPYLWRRTRYFLDAFFQFAFAVSNPMMRANTGIGFLSEEAAKDRLHERLVSASSSAVNSKLDLSAVVSASQEPKRLPGFTAVAFDQKFGEEFIRDLVIPKGRRESESSEPTDQQQFQALLEMLRAKEESE